MKKESDNRGVVINELLSKVGSSEARARAALEDGKRSKMEVESLTAELAVLSIAMLESQEIVATATATSNAAAAAIAISSDSDNANSADNAANSAALEEEKARLQHSLVVQGEKYQHKLLQQKSMHDAASQAMRDQVRVGVFIAVRWCESVWGR